MRDSQPASGTMAVLLASAGLTFACSTGAIIDEPNATFGPSTSLTTVGDGDGDEPRETETGGESETGSTEPPVPTCDDGLVNQDETDVDCGGPNCDPCATGEACEDDEDCQTQSCVGGTCIEPSCMDGVENGTETDVDCGGPSCEPCVDNLGCAVAGDCVSGVCTGGVCSPPSCGDAVLNGFETDVDCGGPLCDGCQEGEVCGVSDDCLSQFCSGGLCAAADCLSDADCANFNTACTMGTCAGDNTCAATPVNQGQMCDDGDLCSSGSTCQAGSCGGGSPIDCSNLSDTCNLGVCNPDSGMCVAEFANQGNPCDDGNQCTVGSVCTNGGCVDPNDPGYIFHDDFSDNSAGWTLGTEWQIGAAAASACASTCPGDDPAMDHTPTNDNGVAGVLIGGCTNTIQHADYCLTSPPMNTAALGGAAWLTFWRHLHSDYPNFMTSKVEVYNGNTWQQLWVNTCCSCVKDLEWTEQTFDVTAYKNANFRVRFCHAIGSAGVFVSGSWSVDDVTVGPAACTP